MKFGIVRPCTRTIEVVDVDDLRDAKIMAALEPDQTDHGTIFPGLGYVCAEYAMFEHPMSYFAIGRVLYPGNVVLYAYNTSGITVDFDLRPGRLPVTWIGDETAAEAAIKLGTIDRPRAAINGEVYWRWPDPKPNMDEVFRKMAGDMERGRPIQIDDVTIMALPKDKKP